MSRNYKYMWNRTDFDNLDVNNIDSVLGRSTCFYHAQLNEHSLNEKGEITQNQFVSLIKVSFLFNNRYN